MTSARNGNKVQVGLVGCGAYCAQAHARTVYEMADAHIAAISECVFPGEMARRQEQFSIPRAFESCTEMLQAAELDAVIISTPHTRHFAQAKQCLERGLHVLVDKPPACRAEDAQLLVELAESADRHFVVASQRRHNPVFHRIRETVNEGRLGEIKLVQFLYGKCMSPNFVTSWRNDARLSGGGVLFDAGYHLMDSLIWITDQRPVRVSGGLYKNKTRVETSVMLSLELEAGALANIGVHLDMPNDLLRQEIGIFGSEGLLLYQYLSAGNNVISSRLITSEQGHQSREDIKKDEDIDKAPARNFIRAILGVESPISPGSESVETVRAIEWIYRTLIPAGIGLREYK